MSSTHYTKFYRGCVVADSLTCKSLYTDDYRGENPITAALGAVACPCGAPLGLVWKNLDLMRCAI